MQVSTALPVRQPNTHYSTISSNQNSGDAEHYPEAEQLGPYSSGNFDPTAHDHDMLQSGENEDNSGLPFHQFSFCPPANAGDGVPAVFPSGGLLDPDEDGLYGADPEDDFQMRREYQHSCRIVNMTE